MHSLASLRLIEVSRKKVATVCSRTIKKDKSNNCCKKHDKYTYINLALQQKLFTSGLVVACSLASTALELSSPHIL